MNIKFIAFVAALQWLGTDLSAQKNADINWVGGFEEYPHVAGYANYVIRFQAGGISVDTLNFDINIESTVASISDSSGQLLFFTNGCVVADAQGNVLDGGTGLNPGTLHDLVCDKTGYIVPKGAMILPAPGDSSLFYLFHLGAEHINGNTFTCGPLYFTLVNYDASNGTGSVMSKNNILLTGSLEPFTAVRHGNGRDWWILQPEWGTDNIHTFLLSPTGLAGPFSAETGASLDGKRIGATAISPDGSRFARFHADRGATVLDFDRCSGAFSASRFIPAPFPLLWGGGVAFSPNSRLLYATSQSTLYEVDLTSSNPVWDTVFYVFDNYTWGTTLHHLQYGPDGKLYFNTHSRANYLSALEFPTPSGASIFHFKSLPLGVKNARTLPNFPNFRLYDLPGSTCDTLGIDSPPMVSTHLLSEVSAPRVFPNPATGTITIVSEDARIVPRRIRFFNLQGYLLLDRELPAHMHTSDFDISVLLSGTYVIVIDCEDHRLFLQRLVIIR